MFDLTLILNHALDQQQFGVSFLCVVCGTTHILLSRVMCRAPLLPKTSRLGIMDNGGAAIAPSLHSMKYAYMPQTPSNVSSPPVYAKTPAAPDSAMAPPVPNPTPSSAVRAAPAAIQSNTVMLQPYPGAAAAGNPAPCTSADYPSLKVKTPRSGCSLARSQPPQARTRI